MGRSPVVPPELLAAPFRTRYAASLGVSKATLRGPVFRAPFAGVRVAASLEDTLRLRSAAALLALPAGSVLSCHTAAELRRLPVRKESAIHADIPVGRGRTRIDGIAAHCRTVSSVRVQGLPVCTSVENFLELAEHLSLVDLVIVGDALVRHGWVQLDDLRAAVAGALGRRGIRRARRGASLVRTRVDSPMETRIRLLLVLAGMPCPVPGFRVMQDGQLIGFVDLAYPEYMVVLEYDGDLHRVLKRKWRMDVATREALRDLGWTVIVLTADDYAVRPAHTVGRVARELVRRGHSDVPPVWGSGTVDARTFGPEWQAAFPGTARAAWDWADDPPA